MSKGNIVLGYGRGAVGDLVLTRLKGQQVSKARNRHPNNPRTSLQMRQRAGFVAPLKFYTRGTQNFFQFAFENRRAKESDYNAFMRMNVGQGFPLTPSEFESRQFPALGNWQLTYGSLPPVPVRLLSTYSNSIVIDLPLPSASATWGVVSSMLVKAGAAQVGDIFTALVVDCDGTVCTATSIDVSPSVIPIWRIWQKRIDPSSSEPFPLPGCPLRLITDSGSTYVGISASDFPVNETCDALGIVISRPTTKGLRVSSSVLKWGGYVQEFINFRNSASEIQRVLAEWGANSTAILNGGML